IPVGGDHFSRATSNALQIKLEEAKLLRVKIAQVAASATGTAAPAAPATPAEPRQQMSVENSFALHSASTPPDPAETPAPTAPPAPADELATADPELAQQARLVEQACREPLHRLVEELELCRRYYEMTFQGRPVNRLIFVGGEARQKGLCQNLARSLGLAAQV